MTKHDSYQDYVIKDGVLIGEFEDMYRDFDDPWEQTTREQHAIEKEIGLLLLDKFKHKRPLEYGCGFGAYTDRMRLITGYGGGVDISQTAIAKAKKNYPECDFYVGDLLDKRILHDARPDCICMVEVTWYVLDKLQEFKDILQEEMKGCGFFHALMTYKEGEQQYGAEYFTNLDQIREYWSDVVDVVEWGKLSKHCYNGGSRTYLYGVIK